MMDLRQHLQDMSGPLVQPSQAQVAADLSRGRRALRRRRTAQTLGASAFGGAALVAAFTFATTGSGAGAPDQLAASGPAASGPAASGPAASGPAASGPAASGPAVVTVVQLVAYQGAQPKGFTIDKVPDGWFIQTDADHSLVLAPKNAQNPGPNPDPSNPAHDPHSFVGKIVIMLESTTQHGPDRKGIDVKVGDRKGVLLKSLPPYGSKPTRADDDTGWELWVQQPSGTYLIVQFWKGLGMSQDQMVELAAGVHVHNTAVQGAG